MKKQERKLLASWIMCPDGTMLPSFHVHDYRTHETVDTWKRRSKKMDDHELVPDKTRHSMIDGGTDYLRRGGKYTEMSIYSDDHFEIIRRFLCRGGRGKDGTEPLTWTPLFAMSDSWVQAVLDYNKDNNIKSPYDEYFVRELEFRKENGIKIED